MPTESDARAYIESSKFPKLVFGDIHVWNIRTKTHARPEHLESMLSLTERTIAKRFTFSRNQDQFRAIRAALRWILAQYVSVPPEAIEFSYGPYGKPSIGGQAIADARLKFNSSHSGDRALLAMSYSSELGVDIERIIPNFDGDVLISHILSSNERIAFAAIPTDQRTRAFFRCLTSKEAYSKGRGCGLWALFEKIDVSIDPREPVRLLSSKSSSSNGDGWYLRELNIGDDYCAVLATAHPVNHIFGHELRYADLPDHIWGDMISIDDGRSAQFTSFLARPWNAIDNHTATRREI